MDAEARESPPVELTQELALKDSNVYLLEAGASMAHEGKRLCRSARHLALRQMNFSE